MGHKIIEFIKKVIKFIFEAIIKLVKGFFEKIIQKWIVVLIAALGLGSAVAYKNSLEPKDCPPVKECTDTVRTLQPIVNNYTKDCSDHLEKYHQ